MQLNILPVCKGCEDLTESTMVSPRFTLSMGLPVTPLAAVAT